jgi:5'-methylthioadenosine phosphorylase
MSRIGFIGGSGLYEMEGAEVVKTVSVDTPFGKPSDGFTIVKLEGKEVVFLPRHGKGHKISPSEINFRANIFGMKKLGVERILSVSACGSLKEEIKPMDFVIPDQFVDRTNQARKQTFFQGGIVAHIAFAEPICKDLAKSLYEATQGLKIKTHKGGTYLNMEGPAFSTLAESNLYRSWGMSIIGMTNLVEAKLAREAEICYVTLAAVTDYDCWHPSHDSVTIDMILNNLRNNIDNAKKILKAVVPKLSKERQCSCKDALKFAIITSKDIIPTKVKKDLEPIIGKYV